MSKAKFKIITALLLLLSVLLNSCSDERSYQHCEMILTLPTSYDKKDPTSPFNLTDSRGAVHAITMSNASKLDLALASENSVVALTRISNEAAQKDGIAPVGSAQAFANLYRDLSGLDSQVKLHGEIPYYVYTLTSNTGVGVKFMATFYKTPYAYFVVLYVALSDIFDGLTDNFLSYAESVRFGAAT